MLIAPARLPPARASIALAAAIAWLAWPAIGKDVPDFLLPWYQHIRAAGPIHAFAAPFSDYSPPYLYLLACATLFAGIAPALTLIKLVSIAGAAALALAARDLLRAVGAAQPERGAALMLVLPTLLINAAVLSQCDTIWSAPCLMAVAAACRRRERAVLAWWGLALAFKLQAVFIAPFVLGVLIRRGISIRSWPIAPAVFAAAMLPAWAAGWPAFDLATIYLRQSGEYPLLVYNAPNIWAIVDQLVAGAGVFNGPAPAAAAGAAAWLTAWMQTRPATPRALLEAALLSALLLPGLLPHMHERYFFLADILSLMLALATRVRRAWLVAALVQIGSLIALAAYMVGIWCLPPLAGLAMILGVRRFAHALRRVGANDNPAAALVFGVAGAAAPQPSSIAR